MVATTILTIGERRLHSKGIAQGSYDDGSSCETATQEVPQEGIWHMFLNGMLCVPGPGYQYVRPAQFIFLPPSAGCQDCALHLVTRSQYIRMSSRH